MHKRLDKKSKKLLGYIGISLFFIVVFISRIEYEQAFFVLPFFIILTWCLLYLGYIKIYRYIDKPVVFFINVLTGIRYFLIPTLIMFDQNYLQYCPLNRGANEKYAVAGSIITLWEEVVVGIFLARMLPRWYCKKNDESYIGRIYDTSEIGVLWLEIAVLAFGVLLSPSVLSGYNFLLNLHNSEVISEAKINGGMYTVAFMSARILKIVIPIPFIQFLYCRYKKKKTKIYYYMSLVVFTVFYAMIMEGNSRNSIIIPAVAVILILYYLYPAFRRTTIALGGAGVISIGIVTLIWKSFRNSVDTVQAMPFSYWIAYVEQYFAGIANMGRAVIARKNYGGHFGLGILLNDLFQNVPFIAGIVNTENTSNYYFAQVWNRTDQVIPSTGNGLFYFGYFLAPLVPIAIILLALFFEKKAFKATSIPELVIYTYATATVSYNVFNTVSSLAMKLSIFIIPAIIVIYINKRCRLRRTLI